MTLLKTKLQNGEQVKGYHILRRKGISGGLQKDNMPH